MSGVSIVMYHYVRDLQRSRFPRIKARTLDEFDRQLEHVRTNFTVVTAEHVVAAIRGEDRLPANAAWLTFDDGFADHYINVLPRLHERGWQGSFYVPQAVTTGVVLDVHKIHFILASAAMQDIVAQIRAFIEGNQSGCDMVFEMCRERYAVANYLDDADTVFVKEMLQRVLPQPFRSQLVHVLFGLYVTKDESAFAAELYMTVDQMAMMARLGHHFGNHFASHDWLAPMSVEDREREFRGGLALLRMIGAWSTAKPAWGVCYPSNSYDAGVIAMAEARGASYGLTANPGPADLVQHSRWELPRLDTNDLPH